MKYLEFEIINFKGIDSIKLNIKNNRIITLVGLNESGKTTIMEAIKAFYEITRYRNLTDSEKNAFRPKGIDFTGDIVLKSIIEYETEDYSRLNEYVKSLKLPYLVSIPKHSLEYTNKFHYELHNFVKHERLVTFPVKASIKNENGKYSQVVLYDYDKEIWNKLLKFVTEELIPEVIYYEDFIFHIPEEISFTNETLKTVSLESEKNITWQYVLDDIIKVVNNKFSSFKEIVVEIWDSDNETALNRISQVEEVLNNKITKSWKELFQKETKQISFKEIKISPKTDGGTFKVSFKVKTDNGKLFSINDRSKGCRWFFSFLIFTEFRKNRTKNILFLLDEPASNLHSSAQIKILEAIKELSQNSIVIYSTHSHHLINPKWLSGAYIIINDKLSEETLRGEMTFEDNSKIKAIKFFNYVGIGKGKTKVSYFQPIIDALDYKPSFIEPVPNIIITEGKYDWYAFTYINEVILENERINFYPGAGRDSLWDIIRLYLSWGSNFVAILDGDSAGIKSQKEYLKEFSPFLENKIFTIKDILKVGYCLEDFFNESDIKNIVISEFSNETYLVVKNNKQKTKELLNSSINLLLYKKKSINLSEETITKFKKLFEFLLNKLKENNSR